MTNLITVLKCDPDLAHINSTQLPQILQTLYVVTGCDYIPFFSQIGKATFLRYFFQYAAFITGSESAEMGSLADVDLENENYKHGYFAFIRLVRNTLLALKQYPQPYTTQSSASKDLQYNNSIGCGLRISDKHSGTEQSSRMK